MRSKRFDEVKITIYGFKTFGESRFADEFFEMLGQVDPSYLPSKIAINEPIKTLFNIEVARKMWVESEKEGGFYGGIMLKGKKVNGDISWNLRDNSNIIWLTVSMDLIIKNNGTNDFIDLAKKLFLWANGVYGHVCHISNGIYTPGLTFRTCLGHIAWMNLYGPPYAKMFGNDVIRTAPCKVAEFAENCFMLLTSDVPMEINPELLEIEERVQKHLGDDAFCRKKVWPATPLTMEDIIAGKDRPSTKGYRSPDLSSYIKDDGRKDSGEGLVVKINDDGTMQTYKVKPKKE